MLYFAELLSDFAEDGKEQAHKVLRNKYSFLQTGYLKEKNVRAAFFYYLTFYEHLGMTLLTDVQSVGKIAEDIERLYCEKTYLDENDLSWIVSSIDNAYLKALIKKIPKINIRSAVR